MWIPLKIPTKIFQQKCQTKVTNQAVKYHFIKGFTFLTFQWMFESHLWEAIKGWTLTMKQFCRMMMDTESSDSSVPAGNTFLGAGGLKVMQVQFVTHLSSQGTAQPSKWAGWIKIPVKIRLILQGTVLFLTGLGVSTTPKVLFIHGWVMDDGSGGHWQTALQPHCCLSFPSTWGRKSRNCFGNSPSPLTMVPCVKSPAGRFQESPALGICWSGQNREQRFSATIPKTLLSLHCPSWQGGRAPGDGAFCRARCPSAPSKAPSVTGLPFLLPAAPPAGTGRAPALPCDHPVPSAITFLLSHPTSSSLWEGNLPTEHLQQLLSLLQFLQLILPDIQRALGRTLTSPKLSHCLGKQHRDKGLWTFPVRKGNSIHL